MDDFLNYVTNNFSSIIEVVLCVVGAFAAIATMTPNTSDDKISQVLLDLVNFLGGNFGKSANDTTTASSTECVKETNVLNAKSGS